MEQTEERLTATFNVTLLLIFPSYDFQKLFDDTKSDQMLLQNKSLDIH